MDASRGNDANAGTSGKPLQTLGRAIEVANAIVGGTVDIKVRPGTYPVAPIVTITRDHVTIEGLSNPILNQDGYLDHFANPVTVVAANFGDQSLWINALILIRASDVAISGLSFISTAEGTSTNVNALIYVLALGFDGQWPGPQGNFTPKALTNDETGHLEANLTANTFTNNSLSDLMIVDESHDHANTHYDQPYTSTTPPVTIHVALTRNSFCN